LFALTRPLPARAASKRLSVVAAIAIALSSCTETPDEPTETVPRGGTLIVNAFVSETTLFSLDPHIAFAAQPWELFRCCLLRTLLSHPGRPTAEGGARLSPDLAASIPEISSDGLTWRFRLKRGLRYGPPFTDTEILAPDVVRALERASRQWEAGGYLYEAIEGFMDVTEGKAESISGLETPDDHTLVVHLAHPSGDIGQLMALPASAPIPPVPNDVEFGAAEGHEDYGPFLVSSGPYMIDGAEDLDFSSSPERLRPAYADRIEVRFVDSIETASEGVVLGEADIVLVAGRPPQVPADIVEEYRGDPALQDRLVFGPRDVMIYLSMNLATPPFDDVHVRKAVNLAVDKATLLDNLGGRPAGDLIGHVVLDSFEDNLLHDYDPYATPEGRGDADRAREEMAQSAYDHDADGICDDPVCRDVLAVAPVFGETPTQDQAESIRSNLEALGIQLDVQVLEAEEGFTRLQDPSAQVAVGI
jgi:peptide/nickel transport system substrate-binding protein